MASQDQINADVQVLSDALTGIAQEITDLKAQIAAQVPETVDLSGLDAIAAKAQSLVPAPVTPPVDNPPVVAPADNTGTLSADGTDNGTGTNPAPTL